jgi:hypothetical protein
MVEYLYDAIKAVAGQEIGISARITDDDGVVAENCRLVLHSDTSDIGSVEGLYLPEDELWAFVIPAEMTNGLKGRYWYCIQHEDINMCFKQPIYLV